MGVRRVAEREPLGDVAPYNPTPDAVEQPFTHLVIFFIFRDIVEEGRAGDEQGSGACQGPTM